MLIYGKEYEKAGYPTLFGVFNELQVKIWTLCWIITTAIVPLLLIYFGSIITLEYSIIIIVLSLLLIISASYLLLSKSEKWKAKLIFHVINLFMVIVLTIKIVQRL